jgi:hypothetical protein
MSIFISINANSIATNANIIAENELKVQKANNQPIFVFDEMRYGNGYFEKLNVYNYGAPINNIFMSSIVLLKVYSYKFNKYTEVDIPIGYYDISTRSGNESNELQQFFTSDVEPLNGNNYRLYKTLDDFDKFKQNNNLSIDINIYKYVYITYEDIYGDKHNDLYIISDFYKHKVSDNEKEKILFDLQENLNKGHFIHIKDLTSEKIYTIFKTYY